jgi:hypothetical protein
MPNSQMVRRFRGWSSAATRTGSARRVSGQGRRRASWRRSLAPNGSWVSAARWIAGVGTCAALVGASAAIARGPVDQSTLHHPTGGGIVINGDFSQAQTFTAGRSGLLDSVDLAVYGGDGQFSVEIHDTDAAGVPTGSALLARTIDGCRAGAPDPALEVPLGAGVHITQGHHYGVTLGWVPGSGTPNTPFGGSLVWTEGLPYDAGAAFGAKPGPSPSWGPTPAQSFGFATYVSEQAPPALSRHRTHTTLTSPRDPAPPGPTTFTASVTDEDDASRVPQGSAVFHLNVEGPSTTVPLDASGRATYTPELGVGATAVSVGYCPSSDAFEGSAATMTQTVTQDVTTTGVAATPSASRVGDLVTLTATVADATNPDREPPGTIQFRSYEGDLGGPVPVESGVASTTTRALTTFSQAVVADYHASDPFFADSNGSTEVSVTKSASSTRLTASPRSLVAGQPMLLLAEVSGAASDGKRPSGPVLFTQQMPYYLLGDTPQLDPGGRAQWRVGAPAGTNRFYAAYYGDGHYEQSFGVIDVEVGRAATRTTLKSDPNPVQTGGALTLTVDVAVVPPGDVPNDGSVQMRVNGQPAGPAIPLAGYDGVIIRAKATDMAAIGTITADYLGGPNTLPSSATVQQQVVAPVAPAAPVAAPPPASAAARLAAMTASLRGALRRRGLAALAGFTQTFDAPVAGQLAQRVYSPSAPANALASRRRPLLVARASRRIAASGTSRIKLKLTRAGRRVVRRAGRARLAVVTRFAALSGPVTRRVDRVTVKARRHSGRVKHARISLGSLRSPWYGVPTAHDLGR